MKVTVTPQDILDLEDAMAALYRAHANADAIRLGALALRFRAESFNHDVDKFLNCDVDESAGMAEVIELNGYSRRVTTPCR